MYTFESTFPPSCSYFYRNEIFIHALYLFIECIKCIRQRQKKCVVVLFCRSCCCFLQAANCCVCENISFLILYVELFIRQTDMLVHRKNWMLDLFISCIIVSVLGSWQKRKKASSMYCHVLFYLI